MDKALVVGVMAAGGTGAVFRYLVDRLIQRQLVRKRTPGIFPWATWCVNMVGCLLFGVASQAVPSSSPWFALLTAGLLGGFTTMSTALVDTVSLILETSFPPALRGMVAAAYLGSMLLVGWLLFQAGAWFGRGWAG